MYTPNGGCICICTLYMYNNRCVHICTYNTNKYCMVGVNNHKTILMKCVCVYVKLITVNICILYVHVILIGIYTVCMYISIIIRMYVHIHTLVLYKHTCMYTPISSKFTYTHH